MGKEKMVIGALDDKLIKGGKELINKLDSLRLVADAALWFYFPDNQSWKLLLSFPLIVAQGPRTAYEAVQKTLTELESMPFSLDDIVVVEPDSLILKLMKSAIVTGPGISGVRFSSNVINGQFIQDAYIYRLMPAKSISPNREAATPS